MNYYDQNIVLLPGFGASQRDYREHETFFSNLVVIDFSKSITLEDHLVDINNHTTVMDKFILVGISWGAVIALFYSNRYPERVTGHLLGGAGRRMNISLSLRMVLELPFRLFMICSILFVLAFPVFFNFDRTGYRQKYGGLKVMHRLGWKYAYTVLNKTLKETNYTGSLNQDRVFITLESDLLVRNEEIIDLIKSAKNYHNVCSKYIDPEDGSDIHFTHELDTIIIKEIADFTTKLEYRSEKIYA